MHLFYLVCCECLICDDIFYSCLCTQMHKCLFRRCHLKTPLLIRSSQKQHVKTFSHCCRRTKTTPPLFYWYLVFIISLLQTSNREMWPSFISGS